MITTFTYYAQFNSNALDFARKDRVSVIYMGRLMRKLNIFNVQSTKDWLYLADESGLLTDRNTIFEYVKASGKYQGVFNYEIDYAFDAVGLFEAVAYDDLSTRQ